MGSREYEARRSSNPGSGPGSEKVGTTVGESGVRGRSARDSADESGRESEPPSASGGTEPVERPPAAPLGGVLDARIFDSDTSPSSGFRPSQPPDEIEPHVAVTFNPESEIAPVRSISSVPPSRPDIAGRYRLDERLAEGGMGIIYAGWHVTLDQPVAVKVIRKELVNNADAVKRFMEEARALAQLRGPHVAQVLDAGIEDGSPFIVMELLRGKDLRTLLEQQGQVPLSLAVQLVREACEAVAEAHAKGIVHRDIKPENLFLADSENGGSTLKVIDFGISARQGADGRYDAGSLGPGSPEYMAPEQLLPGSLVDHRADIWSLGVVLFELLTGYVPFGGNNQHEICSGVVAGEPPLLRSERPDIPESLEELVLRCLNKSADERFSSALELAAALAAHESMLQQVPATEQEQATPSDSTSGRRGRLRLAVGVALGGLLGIVGYFVSAHPTDGANQAGAASGLLVEKSRDLSKGAPQGPEVVPVTDGPNVLPVLGDELPLGSPAPRVAGSNGRGAPAPARQRASVPRARAGDAMSDQEINEELEDIGDEMTPLVTSGARSGEEAVEARYALAASKPPSNDKLAADKVEAPDEASAKKTDAASERPLPPVPPLPPLEPAPKPERKPPPSSAFPDTHE